MNKDPLWRSFDVIFPETSDSASRASLMKQLQELEKIEDSFCGLFYRNKKAFDAISTSVRNVLGYGPEKFLDAEQAVPFFFSKVVPESIPALLQQQAFHFKQALAADLDRQKPYIMEFEAIMMNVLGKTIPLYAQSLVVNYLPTGEIGLMMGCWYSPKDTSAENIANLREKINRILVGVKKNYVTLYPQQFQKPVVLPGNVLIKYFYLNPHRIKISTREQQILMGLGKGHNSRELAAELKISFHTVESHRKNLIEKFKVKNTAELIKEASKLYSLSDPNAPAGESPDTQSLKISGQEKRILMGLAKGETSKELSANMSISFNTAEFHRKNLLRKFEAKNVAQLIQKASTRYWLD